MAKKSKNKKIRDEFEQYCEEHPDERFWQALRNWSGCNFIFAANIVGDPRKILPGTIIDTFYWEGKNDIR